jgi:pimeloyl-ACP methyl ester carboxylesterase
MDVILVRADATLRATVSGSGPTVLLLHAGGERREVWAPVSARLTALRTVAFDLRGHGDSSGRASTLRPIADDVSAMVEREPAPIVVVGASLGGLAAIAALGSPSTAGRVAGLVLVDVVPDPPPGPVRAWLDDRGLRDDHAALVADTLAAGPELRAIVAALDLPVLLVRGGPGSPVTDADVDRLRAANPRVITACVPLAGHLVARDAPAELARIVSAQARTWFGLEEARGGVSVP